MLLAIDIGTTKIGFGVFEDDKLRVTLRIATDIHRLADDYASSLLNLLPSQNVALQNINEAVIGCVVPPMVSVFEDLCKRYLKCRPLVVGAGVRTGGRIRIDNPREVGADRVANSVGAYRLYGGPAIVVAMGTATAFDAVSKEGDYLGGAIAPGMEIAAEALFLRTARLPRVELIPPPQAIGKNTVAAMQSGIIFGYLGLVEGIVTRLKQELGEGTKVIATGGYADLIASQTKLVDVVNPHLTLIGLRLIYELNRR